MSEIQSAHSATMTTVFTAQDDVVSFHAIL